MALKLLRQEMQTTLAEASAISELAPYAEQLEAAFAEVECTVKAVNMADNLELGLANATLFLHATGHVVIGWMWLMQALAALRGRSCGEAADSDFYSGKLAAVAFFYGYELPKAFADLRLVAALDTTCYDLTDEQFIGV
jgi:butyryl-CoA dehydrogenase